MVLHDEPSITDAPRFATAVKSEVNMSMIMGIIINMYCKM